uniref:Pyridoxamine 5'-phosphate oxidase N-terminal domain-containing protein n=1 Tax=Corethron hystrix TaxID=216773 RepID=A0A7S1C142_9STRA|mmetsp:Transcript_9924/g.22144  ORF Transcript_9924/g.22144 Transcript_9924/m.22144 type:complete len:300 (+) Transcript_9924:169-1068(+)
MPKSIFTHSIFLCLVLVLIALVTIKVQPTWRDVGFALYGILVLPALISVQTYCKQLLQTLRPHKNHGRHFVEDKKNTIRSIEQLRGVFPSGLGGSTFTDAKKIISHLDSQMIGFIRQSPLLQLATVDAAGGPFVSPKGDEPGFVSIRNHENCNANSEGTTLIIPDRPGNRLLFGLQNILENPNVGIVFEIPGTCTTLRCGGIAHISKDLDLLQNHVTRKCIPKVVIIVEIDYAFFHCAKSYMRSRIWDPSTWPSKKYKVGFGQYFVRKGSTFANQIDKDVQEHYDKVKLAILGECKEID